MIFKQIDNFENINFIGLLTYFGNNYDFSNFKMKSMFYC